MTAVSQFNPLAPDTLECPFPFYEAIRNDEPVYEVPGAGFFIVSRYEDIVEAAKNPAVFSSHSGPGLRGAPDDELVEVMQQGYLPVNTLLTNDPPDHYRYRSLVNKAFSARRVAQLEPGIRKIANQLVDDFIAEGHAELISRFAVSLPLTVIADALGVPRADMATFKRWSDDSVAPLGGMISHDREIECARSVVEFQHYFAARLDGRRAEPRDDILTDLVNARLDGEKPLDTQEMLSILQQLLVAGNETTTNMIGSTMLLLLQHPKQLSFATADHSLIPNLIEESLRLESPVQGLFRVTTIDTELGGVSIPAGSRVILMYASGNRDGQQYRDPHLFDVRRANAKTHLAFGQGVHFCLGAALARLEGVVAFETLLSRLRNIRLSPGKNDLTHAPSFILRGLKELHLDFDPA